MRATYMPMLWVSRRSGQGESGEVSRARSGTDRVAGEDAGAGGIGANLR